MPDTASTFFVILERALEDEGQWPRMAAHATEYMRAHWYTGPRGHAADRGVLKVYAAVKDAGDAFLPFRVLYELWKKQGGTHGRCH